MSESINPYRAPSSVAFDGAGDPKPGEWIPERLHFRGHVTVDDHRHAVTRTGIRVDYLSTGMILISLATFAGLLVLAIALVLGRVGGTELFFLGLVVLALAAFQFNHQYLVGGQIPEYQFAVGLIEGWIDSEQLVIQSPEFTFEIPISQLTGSVCDGRLWVLSFHRTLMFWQTLPIGAFDDPDVARAVAADLQHLFPPGRPELFDARSQRQPAAEFRFQAGHDAVYYNGWFRQPDADGTRLIKATRQVARRSWGLMAGMLVCLMVSVIFVTGMEWEYAVIMVCWMVGVVAMLLFKRWRSLRSQEEPGYGSLWYSKGWVDHQGYCSMTVLGQSQIRWTFFDHWEVTEKAIVLYPHRSDACACLIARSQFSGDDDWQRAVDLIRQQFAPTLS